MNLIKNGTGAELNFVPKPPPVFANDCATITIFADQKWVSESARSSDVAAPALICFSIHDCNHSRTPFLVSPCYQPLISIDCNERNVLKRDAPAANRSIPELNDEKTAGFTNMCGPSQNGMGSSISVFTAVTSPPAFSSPESSSSRFAVETNSKWLATRTVDVR
jgi:hypothetical protein